MSNAAPITFLIVVVVAAVCLYFFRDKIPALAKKKPSAPPVGNPNGPDAAKGQGNGKGDGKGKGA